MALIAVTTAGRVKVVGIPECQLTLPAGEAIVAGAPVFISTTLGTWFNALGTTAPNARAYGIATRSVAVGIPVTAIKRGRMSGFTFSQAYDAAIYLSDTSGRLGDAAGTVSLVVGRVVPETAEPTGTAYGKILDIDL